MTDKNLQGRMSTKRVSYGFGTIYLGIYFYRGEWRLSTGVVLRPVLGRGGFVKGYNFFPENPETNGAAHTCIVQKKFLYSLDEQDKANKMLFKLRLKGTSPK